MTQQLNALRQLREQTDKLITRYERPGTYWVSWASFYDALQYVDGVEDAASEQLENSLIELGYTHDGYTTDRDGERVELAYKFLPKPSAERIAA